MMEDRKLNPKKWILYVKTLKVLLQRYCLPELKGIYHPELIFS